MTAYYIGVPEECVPYGGQVHIAANAAITIDPRILVRTELEKAKQDAIESSAEIDGTPIVFEVEFTAPPNRGSAGVIVKDEGHRNVREVVLRRIVWSA